MKLPKIEEAFPSDENMKCPRNSNDIENILPVEVHHNIQEKLDLLMDLVSKQDGGESSSNNNFEGGSVSKHSSESELNNLMSGLQISPVINTGLINY